MKNIESKIREETLRHFEGSKEVEHISRYRVFSPNRKYFFDTITYSKPIDNGVTFGYYFTTKIDIYDTKNQEKLFEFLRNDPYSYHHWLEIEEIDYLFLSEFQDGMSVYNLTEKKFESYIGAEDRHQILQYYPSPDKQKMAVVKCGLNDLVIEILDMSEPMRLPYPIVYKMEVDRNTHIIDTIIWKNSVDIDVNYKHQIRIGKNLLKVEVFEAFDDNFWLKCRFKDIHGKEYVCTEKAQAMIGFVDENTKFPISSYFDVEIVKKYTLNNEKICTVAIDLGSPYANVHMIDVFDTEIETNWYFKDKIKQ